MLPRGLMAIKRQRRLIGRALAFGLVMFAGYVGGFGLGWWRAEAVQELDSVRQGGPPSPTFLLIPQWLEWLCPRYDFGYAHSRYSDFFVTDPGPIGDAAILVLGGAVAGRCLATLIPVTIALPGLAATPSSDLQAARREWRALLHRRTDAMWLWTAVAIVGGFGGGLMGDTWAMVHAHFSQEAAWTRGAPLSVAYLKPVWGSLALPDAVWVVAWAFFAPIVLSIGIARERFMARDAALGRRCVHCGYAKPRSATTCPECGTTVGLAFKTSRFRHRLVIVLGVAFLGVFSAFVIVPWLTLA